MKILGPRPPIGGGPWAILATETDHLGRFEFWREKVIALRFRRETTHSVFRDGIVWKSECMKVRFIMLQKYISRWQLHEGSFILSHTHSHHSMCRIACPLFLVLILCQLDNDTAGTFAFFLKLHTPHDELGVVLLCICIDCACIIRRLMLMGKAAAPV